MTYNKINVILR